MMGKNRPPLFVVALALCGAVPTCSVAESSNLGYSNFGGPGLLDMPTAFSQPDGQLGLNTTTFQNTRRYNLSFQLTPRLSTTFRYAQIYDLNIAGDPDNPIIEDFRFDRSFSLHYRLIDERRWRPALAVGFNDFLGTGLFEGEYLVGSKQLTDQLQVSLGIGWGRLGSFGSFDNPLSLFGNGWSERGPRTTTSLGGQIDAIDWFRGPAALFGGVEWQPNDRLRFVAEYSSDTYIYEDGYSFVQRSPLNLGFSYQVTPSLSLDAQYLYGSEFAAGFTYSLNPRNGPTGSGYDPTPLPVLHRDDHAAATWSTDPTTVRATTAAALESQEIIFFGLDVDGRTARVSVENETYLSRAQVIGRTMRALTYTMPLTVENFAVTLIENGIPVTEITLARSDLESLEFDLDGAWLSYTRATIDDSVDAPIDLGLFPRFDWGLRPSLSYSLFDPDAPLRVGFGADLWAEYEPIPGVVISGVIRQSLLGNLDDATRPSTSILPRVRSESNIYDKANPAISRLTAAWYFRPRDDLFGRVTVGYLESMFAGMSGELLWAPSDSRLALGIEVNEAIQRDFDQDLELRDYQVMTGHVSAYYDLPSGYGFQLDAGRYLAGDWGATLTVDRTFGNGWRVAAFATLTDVPFDEFGEGSFDKGIMLEVPLSWATGQPDQRVAPLTIRPVLRDGGARLDIEGRLYDVVSGSHGSDVSDAWGRFWR